MSQKLKKSTTPLPADSLSRRFCMGVILSLWILAPFFLLQKFSLYRPFSIKPLFLDKLVAYEPLAIYPYLLFFIPLIWVFFTTSHEVFIKLCKSLALVSLVSHLSFFFLPTGVVSGQYTVVDSAEPSMLYHWLDVLQHPRNSIPSLYAAVAMLSLCAWWREHSLMKFTALLWTAVALWAVLALKQNYLIGEVSGIILALTVWFFLSAARTTKHSGKEG